MKNKFRLEKQKYIDLFEKAFIIYRLTSYSRNPHNELKSSKKIYFYDNKKNVSCPAAFKTAYPEIEFKVINKSNFIDYL